MPRYRVYCLDVSDRIALADWIDADDDKAIVEQVRDLKRNAHRCEIWEHQRLVATLSQKDLAA